MDQTSAESVKQAIDRVAVTYGRIDVLYMNAGKQRHLVKQQFSIFQSVCVVYGCIHTALAMYTPVKIAPLLTGNQFVGDTVNSDLRQMMLTFDTNFWGPIRVLQASLPLMPTSGETNSSYGLHERLSGVPGRPQRLT